ncbi:MAG: hypothetical protein ACI4HI_10355 [Lachnospiraceae bacterium]
MATDLKRFTISVTPEMEERLDKAKQELYYKDTQNRMIRDLILLGLNAIEGDSKVGEKQQK